jgi:hypothetical protein
MKKKAFLTFFILSLLALFSLGVKEAFATDTLFDSYEVTPTDAYQVRDVGWKGQTFTASDSYSLTSVKILIYKSDGTPGNVVLGIKATSAGLPTGSELGSVTIAGSSLTTNTAGEWKEFVFSSPISLTSATQYALIVRCPTCDESNRIRWKLVGTGTYSGGTQVLSGDSGSSWSTDIPDFLFQTYGTTESTPVYGCTDPKANNYDPDLIHQD